MTGKIRTDCHLSALAAAPGDITGVRFSLNCWERVVLGSDSAVEDVGEVGEVLTRRIHSAP